LTNPWPGITRGFCDFTRTKQKITTRAKTISIKQTRKVWTLRHQRSKPFACNSCESVQLKVVPKLFCCSYPFVRSEHS